MIEQDTVKLLRECDAGARMGISSIGQVKGSVHSDAMRRLLEKSEGEHKALSEEINACLEVYHDEGKQPSAMAEAMSRIETGIKLSVSSSDATIADILTDGCGMGIKSLSRYLNQYEAADEQSKDIARRLVRAEEDLCSGIRPFL